MFSARFCRVVAAGATRALGATAAGLETGRGPEVPLQATRATVGASDKTNRSTRRYAATRIDGGYVARREYAYDDHASLERAQPSIHRATSCVDAQRRDQHQPHPCGVSKIDRLLLSLVHGPRPIHRGSRG